MRPYFRHVIFDRDSVLNAESRDGGYVCTWDQWRWLPGVLGSLARLSSVGVCTSVATNQACVDRGLVTRDVWIHAISQALEENAGGQPS